MKWSFLELFYEVVAVIHGSNVSYNTFGHFATNEFGHGGRKNLALPIIYISNTPSLTLAWVPMLEGWPVSIGFTELQRYQLHFESGHDIRA
jgi:hypothetical protein